MLVWKNFILYWRILPKQKFRSWHPEVKDEIRKLVLRHPTCKIFQREFQYDDLNGKDLVILATDNRVLHEEIKAQATEKSILVNVADTPDLCDFYLGSIVQKGNLKIAISTNGKSPTAAKRIKEVLHEALPGELDDVIENLHKVRSKLNGNFEYKVKKLNRLTRTLIENDNSFNARDGGVLLPILCWLLLLCLLVILFFLICPCNRWLTILINGIKH
jgi:siroheme synthase-like protein